MKVFYVVHGAVQGVGYRSHVRAAAQKHRIKGMVRNMHDGSVEICAEGAKESILGFEKSINVSVHGGPQVFHIRRFEEGEEGFRDMIPYEGFIVGSTA